MSKKVIHVSHLNRKSKAFSIKKVFDLIKVRISSDIIISDIFAVSSFENPFSILKNLFFFLYHRLVNRKTDIFHVTGVLHYVFIVLPRKKSILTLHDCIKFHQHTGLKQWIVKQFWFKLPVYFFKRIIVVSEETKRELIYITNCNYDKIEVIYNPLDPRLYFSPKPIDNLEPKILLIGTDPNKNIYRQIDALKNINCHLTLIGYINKDCQEKLRLNNIKYSNLVGLSDDEIIREYQKCDIVCFATLYEGFGLPIIEAQATGRVVITSDIEPHREIGALGALYVDPLSVDEIHQAICRIIQDAELRKNLIKEGIENINRFDPQKIANQYASLYKKIVTQKKR